MKRHEKRKISQFEWYAILIGAMVGVGVTTLPREVTAEAGRDGWISITIAALVVLIYSQICIYYAKMFPDKTLAQSSVLVLGKYLGSAVIILYALYTFITAAAVLRMFMELVYIYIQITVPLILILFINLAIIVYLSRCGLGTLSRFTIVIMFATGPLFFLFFQPAFAGEYVNLLPVLEWGVMPPLIATQEAVLAFLGIELILIFYPYINNKKSFSRVTTLAIGSVWFIYASITAVVVLMMGVEQVELIYWPFLEHMKLVEMEIFERLDTLFIYMWTSKIVLVAGIQYFAGTFSLAHLTNKDYHDIWSLACWPIVLVAAWYPDSTPQVEELAGTTALYGGILIVAIPIILIIVAKIRGVKNE
ncbi:endospore germination permease [Proteinivorax hydrogeniformans]|uniref:Endospore germination permease n=1 Tax=Proteinivorax hydrogeniformans TaxID=1826727 RepID=A0AAU8HUW2_9FIRM